jgi:mitochondrial inner membrane protein COX18
MLSSSRSFALRRLAAPPPRPRFGLHDQRVALSLRGRRSFTTPAIESLSEGFLDLALALPIPPSLPPYSATIVIVTVVSRLLFTVPFSLWVCLHILMP